MRLIGADGEQVGIMPLSEALNMAQERGLDLVEVAPKAKPPVCRVLDYGKFKYEQSKKNKEAKKNQNVVNVKEVQMGVKIEDHDFQVKARMARRFLSDKDKVKVRLKFRGREITHKEIGYQLMDCLIKETEDLGRVERRPRMEGRDMLMILAPLGD